jgi:3-oxoacyl-[acyl-carrier protein] reductase
MADPKIMLITGTRKGIGRELVHHYVEQGYIVAGCSRGDADYELENYHHYCVDVADEKGISKMLADVRKKFGRLDVLINNAGIASMNHILLTPLSTVQNIINTNLIGTFLCCRESAKLMQKNGYGRIVNFATVATPLRLEGEAIYAASKAAVVNLTEVLARELSAYGITVNSVGPTPVKTDLIKSVPQAKMNALLARQAIPRYGEFADVVNVTDFFISPQSSFVTGQTIYLGGVF